MLTTQEVAARRDRDRARDERRAATLARLHAELAATLGEAWKPGRIQEHVISITREDNTGLWLSVDSEGERISICPFFQPGFHPSRSGRGRLDITVDANRTTASIAREITRRLLPTAEPLFAEANEHARAEAERKTAHEAAIRFLGGHGFRAADNGGGYYIAAPDGMDVEDCRDGTFRVLLRHATPARVVRIAEIIAEEPT